MAAKSDTREISNSKNSLRVVATIRRDPVELIACGSVTRLVVVRLVLLCLILQNKY